jgi:hypothetical protein
MKIQFKTSRFITGVTAVCVLAIATTASAAKDVELQMVDDQLTIISKPGANGCGVFSSRDKGCIKFKKNEKKSKISFHLKGDTKCGLESGTSWELSAVYLGGFEHNIKPDKDKFGFDNTDETDFNKVDYDFDIADRTSGLVTLVEPEDQSADKKIAINNNNKYKYNVWYKIEAICKRQDGDPAHTSSSDPRVRNGGTE